jgi:signal transduction histidine kinase
MLTPLLGDRSALERATYEREQAEEEFRSMTAHTRCILLHGEVAGLPGWDHEPLGPDDHPFAWTIFVQDEYAAQQVLPLDVPPDSNYVDTWAHSRLVEDHRRMQQTSARVISRGETHYEQEYRCIDRNGNCRWLSENITLRPMEYGHWRMFGVVTDITDRKQVEQQLREAKDAAEAASQAKDQFLAMLSHELRTPLTPVLATVNLLEGRGDLPEDLRSELETIRRNVEMEARLIDDLLDLTRINRGKVELRNEVIDANASLQSAVQICRGDIDAKGITLSLDLHADHSRVWADSARVQQVFWNLLKNAVKFTPRGGKISVTMRESAGINGHATDRILFVEISDTGIGIDPDHIHRLFDAFEQGERAITQQYGGLGLGLAISKALVEMQGGTLTAKSDGRDRGATFTVSFPITTKTADVTDTTAARPIEDGKGATILLVEDHADTLRVMSRLLGIAGYNVLTATAMAEALQVAAQNEIHLVVSDLGLPDGSGIDLMRSLKERSPVKGIALSGFGMDEDIRKSEEAGFLRHLTKPVNFQVLEDVIREVLIAK